MSSMARLNFSMYFLSAKWAAGRVRSFGGGGGSLKSMMFVVGGGQQLVGVAPAGRSAGPHLVTSGAGTGAARVRLGAAMERPPMPRRMFLRSSFCLFSELVVFLGF